MTVHHVPPNTAPIDQIWAFVSTDPGGEGICAAVVNGLTFPMVTATGSNVGLMTETARQLAKQTGKTIKLIKFTAREDVEEFSP